MKSAIEILEQQKQSQKGKTLHVNKTKPHKSTIGYTYDYTDSLHFVDYAFTSMLDLFREDIDGQVEAYMAIVKPSLVWRCAGPFTYLCYDCAPIDLIDGIAINLRISRGQGIL